MVLARQTINGNNLITVTTSGGQPKPLISHMAASTENISPAMSHDRTTIAYVQIDAHHRRSVYLIGSDGNNDRWLYKTAPAACESFARPAFRPGDAELVVPCVVSNTGYRSRSRLRALMGVAADHHGFPRGRATDDASLGGRPQPLGQCLSDDGSLVTTASLIISSTPAGRPVSTQGSSATASRDGFHSRARVAVVGA